MTFRGSPTVQDCFESYAQVITLSILIQCSRYLFIKYMSFDTGYVVKFMVFLVWLTVLLLFQDNAIVWLFAKLKLENKSFSCNKSKN